MRQLWWFAKEHGETQGATREKMRGFEHTERRDWPGRSCDNTRGRHLRRLLCHEAVKQYTVISFVMPPQEGRPYRSGLDK